MSGGSPGSGQGHGQPPEIREFRPSDAGPVGHCIAQLQDFERRIDARVLPGEAVAGWYLIHLQSECAEKVGMIFVAEVEGAIAGFAAVQARVPNEDKDEEPYEFAYISDLAVLDRYRNRGIGRALIARAEAFAREKGASWLRISVLARNEVARRLYERRGFEERLILLEKALSSR